MEALLILQFTSALSATSGSSDADGCATAPRHTCCAELFNGPMPTPILKDGSIEREAVEQLLRAAPSPSKSETFISLASQLEDATFSMSNPNRMVQHPLAKSILDFPEVVSIPLMVQRLDEQPVLWISMLSEVAGEIDIPVTDRGRIPAIVQSWKTWALEHRYV